MPKSSKPKSRNLYLGVPPIVLEILFSAQQTIIRNGDNPYQCIYVHHEHEALIQNGGEIAGVVIKPEWYLTDNFEKTEVGALIYDYRSNTWKRRDKWTGQDTAMTESEVRLFAREWFNIDPNDPKP